MRPAWATTLPSRRGTGQRRLGGRVRGAERGQQPRGAPRRRRGDPQRRHDGPWMTAGEPPEGNGVRRRARSGEVHLDRDTAGPGPTPQPAGQHDRPVRTALQGAKRSGDGNPEAATDDSGHLDTAVRPRACDPRQRRRPPQPAELRRQRPLRPIDGPSLCAIDHRQHHAQPRPHAQPSGNRDRELAVRADGRRLVRSCDQERRQSAQTTHAQRHRQRHPRRHATQHHDALADQPPRHRRRRSGRRRRRQGRRQRAN